MDTESDKRSEMAFEITKNVTESSAKALENVRSGGLVGDLRDQIDQLQAELERYKKALCDIAGDEHDVNWYKCYAKEVAVDALKGEQE